MHIVSPDGKVFWKSKKGHTFAFMPPNGFWEIKLDNPSLQHDGYLFSFTMQCKDEYNDVHNYSINGTYYAKDSFPRLSIKEII